MWLTLVAANSDKQNLTSTGAIAVNVLTLPTQADLFEDSSFLV